MAPGGVGSSGLSSGHQRLVAGFFQYSAMGRIQQVPSPRSEGPLDLSSAQWDVSHRLMG